MRSCFYIILIFYFKLSFSSALLNIRCQFMPSQLLNINTMYFKFPNAPPVHNHGTFFNIFNVIKLLSTKLAQDHTNRTYLSSIVFVWTSSRIPVAVYNQMTLLLYLLKKNMDHNTSHCKISQPMRNKLDCSQSTIFL